ncbi:gibberellin-regulated protein 6-like [Pyrus ussuriensis x Pyrus communis]|uniref:Gibberellin-regulated protein 6-like n=1 Tax=Pyrus ussuriensis x Pyrus communis TaxID=2448454 RepID=A0A5N5GEZ6_9ROSA|nr:gibberellin-regulated protein 6-like [Pyrus ussuriensis x Pyrus communis]
MILTFLIFCLTLCILQECGNDKLPHKPLKRKRILLLVIVECPSQCTRRCSQTQYHKPCMFFCQKCCKKCLCVPPGFYGNKAACPCYNNWKTQQGGPKCP